MSLKRDNSLVIPPSNGVMETGFSPAYLSEKERDWQEMLNAPRHTPEEMEKWARKYLLWKKLHHSWTDGMGNCMACPHYLGNDHFTCPYFVMTNLSDTEFYETNHNSIAKRYCKEWVKYV